MAPTATAPFTADDIAAERAAVAGRVLLPGEPGFAEINGRIFNHMFADRTPAVIFQPRGTADVVRAVRFGVKHKLPVVPRCGGHSAAGRSTTDGGVLVDLSQLHHVVVDRVQSRVHIGGGCVLGDVDRELALHGLAVPLGTYQNTGCGGLMLHGGMGLLSAAHGLSVDNILEAEVVTAAGEVIVASPTTHEDLFFGIRGAASFFGVVTRITLQTFPIAPEVHGGCILQPLAQFSDLARHIEVQLRRTKERTELGAFKFLVGGPNGPAVMTLACDTSADEARALEPLNEFASLGPVVAGGFSRAPFWRINSSFGDFIHAKPPPPSRQYWRGFVVPTSRATEPDFQAAFQEAARLAITSEHTPTTLIIFEPWQHGIATHPNASPICNIRGSYVVFAFIFGWLTHQPDEPAMQVVHQATELMLPFVADLNYINYTGQPDAPAKLGRPISEDVRTKLRALKAKWDPGNFFPTL